MNRRYKLLSGVVGSQAYGLAHAGSDTDRFDVFTYNTADLMGLNTPPESVVLHNPDTTAHEAKKFCNLALKCNPTVTEFLWLDEYEFAAPHGIDLIAIRSDFLSQKYVRNAYLGYATSQFNRIRRNENDPEKGKKNARHLLRLLNQGTLLWATGTVFVRVSEPELLTQQANEIYNDPTLAKQYLDRAARIFDESKTFLPEEPNFNSVNDWLLSVRESYTL